MTTSIWDNEQLRAQYPHCATLGEIIRALEEDFSKRGEVICEIRVNGVLLDEADEVKFTGNASDGIQDLTIASNSPEQLIGGALASALTFIPEIEAACITSAEALRGPDAANARRSFVEILDGCQWLVDTILHVRGAASGVGRPVKSSEKWFEAEKLMNNVIVEVTDAFTKSDTVLVADLLEYELPTALSLWAETLKEEQASR
ncbi:MAG TPA: hypothetical protein VM432_12950 [Bdellovibrionales bacterium]|nr:hypothetical protein [Bdellovibrionales bacterium]